MDIPDKGYRQQVYELVMDRRGQIRHLSPPTEQLLECTLADVRGTCFSESFMRPDQAQVVQSFFERMTPDMFPNQASYYWISRSGAEHLIHMTNTVTTDAEGSVDLVTCTGYDLERAQLAEDIFELVINTSMDGFCLNSLDGTFIDVNDRYAEMLQMTREEIRGTNVADFEVTLTHDQVVETMTGVKEVGHSIFEGKNRRKDGSLIDVEVSMNYADVEGGRLYSFLRDITERKNIEEERARHREELEALVLERTAQLERANRNLRAEITERKQAEKELQRLNNELEGYAQTVSHELRTPLSGIFLALEYLEQIAGKMAAGETTEIEAIVDKAKATVSKAELKVVDLLELAKAGQVPTEVRDVDVALALSSIVQDLHDEMASADMTIEFDTELGNLKADLQQVNQLFSNLLENAIRYSNRGGRVVVSYLGRDTDGRKRWRVRDEGPGIPEDLLEDIFIPFVKGEDGGSGIGLAIVEKIVKVYDGTIIVTNNGGACFEFALNDYPR